MTQKFIDNVVARTKELMGIPPVFIDRGDPAAVDFDKTNFTIDNAWHDLDLSDIVPSNAKAVSFTSRVSNTGLGVFWHLRKKGNVNNKNIFEQTTQVNGVFLANNGRCPIGTDGKLEYLFIPVGFWFIFFTVKGWWL